MKDVPLIEDPYISPSFDWSKFDRGGIYEIRTYDLVEIVSEARRLPLWERVAIWLLDGLTTVVDALARWISRP